jgi:ubiquinone biosynthesis protein
MPDMLSIRETIDKVGFRMVFGLVLAAVLVSSSLVVLAGVGPMIGDIPIFGFIGFGIGLAMGVMFLFSAIFKMLRWRKRK